MRPRRRPLLHYLAAGSITALAVALRVLLEPVWGATAPFVLLFLAVMLSAWIGGLGPGLLAIALATAAADYFWLEPYRSFTITTAADGALLALFVAVCLGVVFLTEALTRARARLDALLDASPVGLGFHDRSLRYIRVNRALAGINGRPAAEHVGRTTREVLGEAAADVVEPILEQVLRTGRAVHMPVFRVELSATGTERSYSVSYAPARDAVGRVSGVAVSVSDVTEMQRAQEALAHERELLQTVIDSIPVMITMYEPGTRVPRLNREFERVTGWTADEATRVDVVAACVSKPADRATLRESTDAPEPGWRDIRMTTRSGAVVETSWSSIRLSDGSRVAIGIDVTDRKRYEAEMRGARAAAETANRAKDEFIAMLGHELRNPLSAIAGAVGVLQRLGGAEARAASAQDVIARQAQHLARLMDDLLDVGRVVTGKIVLDRRPINLLEAAGRVETMLRATGRVGRHRLSVAGTPAWVDGDGTRIEQVLTNLVTNALKYTRRRGPSVSSSRTAAARRPSGSPTPDAASRPSCCRASSTCSSRASRLPSGHRAASASGSPWCGTWSSCTAAASRRPAPARAPAARSRCTFRACPPRRRPRSGRRGARGRPGAP
jgi:PAS domain S-box-containing protein